MTMTRTPWKPFALHHKTTLVQRDVLTLVGEIQRYRNDPNEQKTESSQKALGGCDKRLLYAWTKVDRTQGVAGSADRVNRRQNWRVQAAPETALSALPEVILLVS